MRYVAIMLVVTLLLQAAVLAERPSPALRFSGQSKSFEVRSVAGGPAAADVLQRCERLREELQRFWLGAEAQEPWRPRCEIVVHAKRASYLQAVGREGGQTSGSSLVRFEHGRMLSRRIDLLVDNQNELPALPHELTHVVLADRFRGKQPPRWLDEGIATMADSVAKKKLHHRDCQHALKTGTALRVIDLLRLEQFTSSQQVPAFYGQSLSLVRFLSSKDEPGRVIDFVEAAVALGYDRALKAHYDIDGVASLERMWREYAAFADPPHMSTARHRP
jgi:hypothetical protein